MNHTQPINMMVAPMPDGTANAHSDVRSYSTANAMNMPPKVCKNVFSLFGRLPSDTNVTQNASIAE